MENRIKEFQETQKEGEVKIKEVISRMLSADIENFSELAYRTLLEYRVAKNEAEHRLIRQIVKDKRY